VLVAEDLLVRQQVIVLSRQVKRPRLRPFDRWILASIAGRFRDLLTAILVAKPETIIRWPSGRLAPTMALAIASAAGPPTHRRRSSPPHPPHVA